MEILKASVSGVRYSDSHVISVHWECKCLFALLFPSVTMITVREQRWSHYIEQGGGLLAEQRSIHPPVCSRPGQRDLVVWGETTTAFWFTLARDAPFYGLPCSVLV